MASIYETLTKGLLGSDARNETAPLGFRPEQIGAVDQLRNLGLQGLQSFQGGMPSFQPIRDKATADFTEFASPRLAQNADNLLGGNASNPFLSQLMSQNAFRGLQRDLSAQEQTFDQNNFNNLMSALRLGLTPTEENIRVDAEPGFLDNLRDSGAAAGFPALMELFKQFTGGEGDQSGQPSWLRKLIQPVGAAATGATAGSTFGPFGAGIGGLLGLLSSVGSMFAGRKGAAQKQLPFGSGPEKNFMPGGSSFSGGR